MQLTRLEIKGFKSFADKVVINFNEGITGIVGPNGCGKSNVVDAIRWVLGEQKTRVLRSEKMENIIFNGTKGRKQTNLAEVSLTFNNTKNLIPTEYSQVTITRRYYRSGDSEYLLNGVACRLKDINNLFLDTGISSDSYAIIELKMVDDILNDKDHSRRTLFEEAAGISKFKIRKKETIKKLSETDADLERVEDLLFEIEKNLKSLERQARQTKRYYEIKEEYKAVSIALAQNSLKNQREIFLNIEQSILSETDKKLTLVSQVADKEARIEQAKKDLLGKEQLLSSRQKSLNQHVAAIRQYESEKKIKNERQRFLNDKIDNINNQIAHDKASNERADFAIKSLEKELTAAQNLSIEVEQGLARLKSDYERQQELTNQAQKTFNGHSNAYSELRDHFFKLEKDIEIKDIQLQSLKSELTKTDEDTTQQEASLATFKDRLEEIIDKRETQLAAYEALRTEADKLNEQLSAFEKERQLIRDEINLINRELDAKQNEYNLTKSLVENLEGFPEAIKFLKKSPDWKDAPLLSDIITCPENYRVTIENYLEPYMNYYVVDTYDQALKAVNLLSDASKGKAHFFVLDRLIDYAMEDTDTLMSGLTPATDVIEYDARYRHLISYLLSNVYIYEGSLPDFQRKGRTVWIDKGGKITHRPYSLSGGSVGLFEGKRIGRAKNLEKLGERIRLLTRKQEEAQRKLDDNHRSIEHLKASINLEQLEQLKDEIGRINETYVSIQTKQEQFGELLNSARSRHSEMENHRALLLQDLAQLKPNYETEKQRLESMAGNIDKMRGELEDLSELLARKSAAYNEENVRFHQRLSSVNSIKQEIGYKREAFNNSQERIEKNQAELQETTQAINDLIRKSTESDHALVSMYQEKESLEEGVNEAEKEYYQARGTIDEEEKKLRELNRLREGIDHVLMEWQTKRSETQLKLQSVKDRLSVEFNVKVDQLEASMNEALAALSESELKQKVDKYKNRLDTMGPINPMAMEAYEEIKERFDFITTQRDDLLEAKQSLLTTISEIDTVARDTFMDAFHKIHDNFIKVFRTLFTEEDDCDLKLSDPENPLESSIEIIAKPKGKKPLTINQLSGGEKTLTATSLLFSIYLLKPAPFCIFDEVDAPLDDANIDKFNQIVREFSKDSQFIIVTHNKRTMASTDVIYGITMVEQGVSRAVPADLRSLA